MGAREFATKYRISQWVNILQDQRPGERVTDFCTRRGIKKDHYYYWLRRVRETLGEEYLRQESTQTGLAVQGFTEVRVTEALATQRVGVTGQIIIENSLCKITADIGYPAETLIVLLRELQKL